SSRRRLASVQARRVGVKPIDRLMNSDESPMRYVSPGPPRKTKPLNAAAIVARPVTTTPSPWRATQKSCALRVTRRGRSRIGTSRLPGAGMAHPPHPVEILLADAVAIEPRGVEPAQTEEGQG